MLKMNINADKVAAQQLRLVDDDPDFRDALDKQLRYAGYRVALAADGGEALVWLHKNHADVLILDIVMPHKEGLETMLALRRSHPQLPVIAISGGGRIEARDYLKIAASLGAAGVLSKPFPLADLQALIEAARRV